MKLYGELASWWRLLSAVEDYEEESAFHTKQLLAHGGEPARTLVEFGSGGGNNAWHMKKHFAATLVDPSEGMLAMSREINPECEHVVGDMRTVRLGRQFDRVFIHDAIVYMTTLDDLRLALTTAFVHCRPGGAALFAPDHVSENFHPSSDHGGHDDDANGRSLRYLEWTGEPEPGANVYHVDYVYALRERGKPLRIEHDLHVEGLFARAEWLALIAEAGFEPRVVPFDHSELEPGTYEVFVGVKPA
jgi:SAM-dependent methyltransferase